MLEAQVEDHPSFATTWSDTNRHSDSGYEELDLDQPWEEFDIRHPLTTRGIEKFVADYKSTLRRVA
jgi:hypothetical protein